MLSKPMMRMLFTTLPPLLYLLLIFLVLSCAFTQRVAAKNMTIRCIERERLALLDFKHGLVDENGVLSSWGNDSHQTECCNWFGIHCNNNTGHVSILDLHPTHLDDYGYPIHQKLIGRKVTPSLLKLKHLKYLDLSYIDFQGSRIPEFIGSFERLRVLNLMYANFSGTIPPQFGNLTNLRVLNITASDLKIRNLEWLSMLSSLRSFYLDDVDIDLTESPETSITLPPFLEVLQMPRCQLSGALPPFSLNSSYSPLLSVVDFSENSLTSSSSVFHFLRNATKHLTTIDLSRNSFTGPIPDSFGDMRFLENLNLRLNSFTNCIPKSFENLTHLQTLDLTENNLIGELPTDMGTRFPSLIELYASGNQLNGSSFGLPSSLEYLDLSGNKIRGLIQDMKCFGQKCNLMYLDLSNNQITGQFPDLSCFSSLREVHLSGNQITGYFPDLSHSLSLRVIDLSENKLHGGLPETIGKLSKLEKLFASSNSLEGVVSEAHFWNLTKLQSLDLSFNAALSFNLSGNWVPPFQLYDVLLANCNMGPQFPKWLQTQSTIVQLDISSSGVSDVIPDWFWNSSSKSYNSLNLSYNQIGGTLPDLPMEFSHIQVVDLSSNNFWGPISTSFREVPVLHLSNNKFVGSISFLCSITGSYDNTISIISVDLSDNQLSGEIPECWDYGIFSSLFILNLANNSFFGKVPQSLGTLSRLQSLHLRNNNFTGELPSSLQNCTSLRVMDFGGNKLSGRVPSWIGGSLRNLVIVSLRLNNFYGKVPSSICHLNSIQILDLSGNKLSGEIPPCFNNFTYLMENSSSIGSTIRSLDATSFQEVVYYIDNILIQWKNKEREYRKQLGLLKTIDLSSNQLIGNIPDGFSALNGLISLNLSKNHLTGKLFPTIYEMENLEVLDLSKNQLYGEIPIGLARLNYLAVLDLSSNFFSGKIPTGTQLQSFNASSYDGNVGLCGDPLPKCSADIPPQSKNNDYQEEDDGFLDRGFYISMVLGFSLSFWGIVVTLVLKDSWRVAYYEFWNDVKDWLYVEVKIYLARLQRKLRRI